MKVKFLKKHSINKVGSIAEYDKVLCDKLIKLEIAIEPSKSDLAEAKKVADSSKKKGEKALKDAEKRRVALSKLHKPVSLIVGKKAIKTARAEAEKKKK